MAAKFERIWIAPVERLALLDLAERRGVTEEVALSDLIRDAVKRELLEPVTEPARIEAAGVHDER